MIQCQTSLHLSHYRHFHCYFPMNCCHCHCRCHLKRPTHFRFLDPWLPPRPSAMASPPLHLHLQKKKQLSPVFCRRDQCISMMKTTIDTVYSIACNIQLDTPHITQYNEKLERRSHLNKVRRPIHKWLQSHPQPHPHPHLSLSSSFAVLGGGTASGWSS